VHLATYYRVNATPEFVGNKVSSEAKPVLDTSACVHDEKSAQVPNQTSNKGRKREAPDAAYLAERNKHIPLSVSITKPESEKSCINEISQNLGNSSASDTKDRGLRHMDSLKIATNEKKIDGSTKRSIMSEDVIDVGDDDNTKTSNYQLSNYTSYQLASA